MDRQTASASLKIVLKKTRRSFASAQTSGETEDTQPPMPPKRSRLLTATPHPLTTEDIPVIVAVIRAPLTVTPTSGGLTTITSTITTTVRSGILDTVTTTASGESTTTTTVSAGSTTTTTVSAGSPTPTTASSDSPTLSTTAASKSTSLTTMAAATGTSDSLRDGETHSTGEQEKPTAQASIRDDVPNSSFQGSSLTDDNGSSQPKLAELVEHVGTSVHEKWYDLGLQLGVNVDTLDQIEDSGYKSNKACRKMFQAWLREKHNGTWNDVILALKSRSVGETDLAESLKELNNPLKYS